MPIFLTNKHERLRLTFPPQPSLLQQTWQRVKAELLTLNAFSSDCQIIDTLVENPLFEDHTIIYYHRLTYAEQREVSDAATERGQLNALVLWMETCKRAIDGWETLYDADLHPVPMPTVTSENERRAGLAAIIEHFPAGVRQAIATQALADTPDFLFSNWHAQLAESSSLPIGRLVSNLPVAIAGSSMPTMNGPSPAIVGD